MKIKTLFWSAAAAVIAADGAAQAQVTFAPRISSPAASTMSATTWCR